MQATSRETVETALPSLRAMAVNESPPHRPRLICPAAEILARAIYALLGPIQDQRVCARRGMQVAVVAAAPQAHRALLAPDHQG